MGIGQTDDLAQGGHHILGGDGMVAASADAVFRAPGGVDDHMVAGLIALTVGVKKVDLLSGPELDVNDLHISLGQIGKFFHWFCSLYSDTLAPSVRGLARRKP